MMMMIMLMMMLMMMMSDEGGDDDDDVDDDDDDDVGLPAYSHQSYSHLVGICHNDEGWEYDTPPGIKPSSIYR